MQPLASEEIISFQPALLAPASQVRRCGTPDGTSMESSTVRRGLAMLALSAVTQIARFRGCGGGNDHERITVHIGREDQRSFDTGLAYAVSRRSGRSVGAWDPA